MDWSRDDHAISVVDDRGREIARCTLTYTAAGLREMVSFLRRHGAGEVAIERPDGPVVDTLLQGGLTVVVISPKSSALAQCVVTVRPSSNPAKASANAPMQIEAIRARRFQARLRATPTEAGGGRR